MARKKVLIKDLPQNIYFQRVINFLNQPPIFKMRRMLNGPNLCVACVFMMPLSRVRGVSRPRVQGAFFQLEANVLQNPDRHFALDGRSPLVPHGLFEGMPHDG